MTDTPPTNGTLKQALREARQQLALAETRQRLRQVEVAESYYAGFSSWTGAGADQGWGGFVDPLDRYRESDRWLFSPWGGDRHERDHGDNRPLVPNEQVLADIRGAARLLATDNGVGQGIAESLVDFLVADGMSFRVTTKEKAARQLMAEAQDVVDEFLELNEYDEFQQELVLRSIIDGEYFLRYFPSGHLLHLRVVEPEHVQQPQGSPYEWSWGIQNPPGDVQTGLCLSVHHGDPDEWEEVPAGQYQHVKRNVPRNVKRGLSDFFSVRGRVREVDKLVRNMTIGESVRAAIVGFWQYEAASSATAGAHVGNTRDAMQPIPRDPWTGKDRNATYYPPGSIPNLPKGKTWLPAPGSPAVPNQVAVVQAALRMILMRWRMPEHFSSDASNNNLASILVAGSPFARAIRRGQKFYRRRFLQPVWAALSLAWQMRRFGKGYTWEEIKFLLDVQCEAQPPELADESKQAEVDHKDIEAGIMSKTTRRQRRGLDEEQERTAIAKEQKEAAAQQAAQQPPGAPPGGAPGGDQAAGPVAQAGVLPPPPGSVSESWTGRGAGQRRPFGLVESALAEAGFSGTLTDTLGRERHYVDGKQVAARKDEAATPDPSAEKEPLKFDLNRAIAPKLAARNESLPGEAWPPPPPGAAFSPVEVAAVKVYSGDDYEDMNNSLRSGSGEPPPHLANVHEELQKAFAKVAVFARPVPVQRGLELQPKALADFLGRMGEAQKGGEKVRLPGYSSTTTDSNVMGDFAANVILRINAVHGIDLGTVSKFPDEKELLLNHESEFVIRAVREDEEGEWVVEMDQLPPKRGVP